MPSIFTKAVLISAAITLTYTAALQAQDATIPYVILPEGQEAQPESPSSSPQGVALPSANVVIQQEGELKALPAPVARPVSGTAGQASGTAGQASGTAGQASETVKPEPVSPDASDTLIDELLTESMDEGNQAEVVTAPTPLPLIEPEAAMQVDEYEVEEPLPKAVPLKRQRVQAAQVSSETTRTLSAPVGVSIAPSSELSVAGVGTLNNKASGLGANLWQHSRASTLPTEFNYVSDTAFHSPTMRDLLLRLALTRALPPSGSAAEGTALLHARYSLLMRMEAYGKLEELLLAVPSSSRDNGWYQLMVRQLLYQFRHADACKQVTIAIALNTSPFWQQMQLFCQAYKKEYEAAALTIELMREQGASPPTWLQRLVLQMAGKEVPDSKKDDTDYSPNGLTLMALGSKTLTAEQLSSQVWQYPAMLAAHPRLDDATRLKAAELAVRKGAWSGERLTKLYDSLAKKGKKTGAALASLNIAESPYDRMQAWAMLQNIYTVAESANGMHAVLEKYRDADLMPLAISTYGQDLQSLSRAIFRKHGFYDAAYIFFSALFSRGDLHEAMLWREGVAKDNSSNMASANDELWDIIADVLEPVEDPSEPIIFSADIQGRIDALRIPPGASPSALTLWKRAGFILASLGYTLPPAVNLRVVPDDPDYGDAAGRIDAIKSAVAEDKKGEALLLMARTNPARMTNAALAISIHSLEKLGLRREALHLAHEGLSHTVIYAGANTGEESADDAR